MINKFNSVYEFCDKQFSKLLKHFSKHRCQGRIWFMFAGITSVMLLAMILVIFMHRYILI
jgi:hypothetical protein